MPRIYKGKRKNRFIWKDEIPRIVELATSGTTQAEIAALYGVTKQYISTIYYKYSLFKSKNEFGAAILRKIEHSRPLTETEGRLRKFTYLKSNAAARDIEFNLVFEEIDWPLCCPVLGITLDYTSFDRHNQHRPSFDRFDPKLGYIKGNVFVISTRANRLKNDASADDLAKVVSWMNKIIVNKTKL